MIKFGEIIKVELEVRGRRWLGEPPMYLSMFSINQAFTKKIRVENMIEDKRKKRKEEKNSKNNNLLVKYTCTYLVMTF